MLKISETLAYAPDQCPVCFSTDLHGATLNDQAAVSCCDCDWIATYAYLKAQADSVNNGRAGE